MEKLLVNIFGVAFILYIIVWSIELLRKFGTSIAINSYKSKWAWVRKLYWNEVRAKMRGDSRYDFKVDSFLMKWINESVVLKEIYIKYGFDTFKLVVSEKRDEYKAKVDKLRYNTFDELDWEENKFIDDYLAQEKKERRKK